MLMQIVVFVNTRICTSAAGFEYGEIICPDIEPFRNEIFKATFKLSVTFGGATILTFISGHGLWQTLYKLNCF